MATKLTPLMEQYWSVKNHHPDKIMMFRMGDFFEMFHDDAVKAAPILNIALTQRNKKSNDNTPMCGMPHHSIAGPIAKLLAAGLKVAICDQVEDPKLAKGLVKREVTRVLTPGMVYDPDSLDQLESNYLCSYNQDDISFLDMSTGEAFYYPLKEADEYKKYMQLLKPAELVFDSFESKKNFPHNFLASIYLTVHDQKTESINNSTLDSSNNLPLSAQLLLDYCESMLGTQRQGTTITDTIRPFEKRNCDIVMNLSPRVLDHLEVFRTYKGEQKGSLFYAINRTKTSAGARRLKQWLQFPLIREKEILVRQQQVAFWQSDVARLKRVREVFTHLGDLERRLSKISLPTCHARDLLSLSESLKAGIAASQLNLEEVLNTQSARDLVIIIQKAIQEEPPGQMKNGGFINKGYDPQLDEYIQLAEESHELLLAMEAAEKQKTQISSLKIRYNNVFGYYIEVTNLHKNKVPDHYKRKQTLTNAERYVTQELHELESKILSAKSKRLDLELEIFKQIKQEVQKRAIDVLNFSQIWSRWDVLSSFAWVALEQNYVLPIFSKSFELNITSSRHPVVEQEVKKEFVPNDIFLENGQCFLLTGPNMAGKSTVMRQVAVTALMAQIGAPVPAKKAELPLYDNIFTRIGASDHLSEGLSTFMVEMVETAELLKRSSNASLIILDEIGRGTSTFDGMSLAQAILEFIVKEKKAMTFFATHYHELTSLSEKFQAIKNVHMAIKEDTNSSQLTFLYTLLSGPTNDSYGIQVAQLAGLPKSVVNEAKNILKKLEKSRPKMSAFEQLNLLDMASSTNIEVTEEPRLGEDIKLLVDQVKNTSVKKMTPLDALNQISKWQQDLS